MAAADTVKSERQKELKVHEGHLFSFDAELLTRPELVYRCVRKNDCRVRIYTSLEGEFIRQLNEHTHGCDPARIEAAKLLDRIKERATQTMEVCC